MIFFITPGSDFVACEQQRRRPACADSLISTFVIHSQLSMIAKLATCKILKIPSSLCS